MIWTVKLQLRPTKEQEQKLLQSTGVSRFAYNWALARQKENHENIGRFLSEKDLLKEFTLLKQQDEFKWLYKSSDNITKRAIKDAGNACKRFIKGESDFPSFKSKRKTRLCFYNDNIKLKIKKDKILIEKVGWIRISESAGISADKLYNLRISYGGKYWYIRLSVEKESLAKKLIEEIKGFFMKCKNIN